MANLPLNARTDAILRRLVRRDATPAIRKVLAKTRNEDIAAAMELMTMGERLRLFQLMDDNEPPARSATPLAS